MTPTSTSPAPSASAVVPSSSSLISRVTPAHLVSGLITLTFVLAEWQFHLVDGPMRMVVALGGCVAVEWALGWAVLGRRVPLLSAWISGTSLTALVRPHGEALWPYVLGAILAIGSKYGLRYRGGHLWNPTNFAVCLLLLVAAPEISVLSDQWGNTWIVNAVVWAFGLLVVMRAGVLHITIAWVASFVVFAWMRATALDLSLAGELAPLTGPMYQLMAFFMMTDPKTTVSTRWGQVAVAIAIAAVEAGMRTGLSLGWDVLDPIAPAPALFALTVVGPTALILDRRRESAG